jgi:23S rRNA (pseudouridine1915-N3)-methyltransferase
MKLQIIAVGRKMPGWVETACEDYLKRVPDNFLSLQTVSPALRKSGQTVQRIQSQEADAIRSKFKPGDYSIALDEHGRQWSSSEWAEQLRRWQLELGRVNLIIGGADGLDKGLLAGVDQKVALGRMTLPHALARVVLIEQLYRARSIVDGHPYHRE